MKFKMQPSADHGLCASCREGHVHEHSDGSVVIACAAMGMHQHVLIRKRIVRCSDYDSKRETSEYEMQKIAWTVTTDRSGKTIGFKPPKPGKD